MFDSNYMIVPTRVEGIDILVPDARDVQDKYSRSAEKDAAVIFPYWTRVWPSAIALARFIKANDQIVAGKRILEIGAGIGLPSFIASASALTVKVTDHIPAAVELMKLNIQHTGSHNMVAGLLDWNTRIAADADLLLLSDVSYEPASFDPLFDLIERYLAAGSEILLSIPQRIVSGQFYELIHKDIISSVDHEIEDKRVIVAHLKRQ